MKHKARLMIPRSALEVINKYLEAETEEEFQGEDNTIINSVKFPDGMVMDIKCCGCQNENSWTEAVLFIPNKNGGLIEVCCSEVDESYLGEWELEFDGDSYVVEVVDGGDINAPVVEPESVEEAVAPDTEKWFGIVRWCNLDVIGAAQANGWNMTEEEATAWWAENERSFKALLTEHGNELLAQMTADHKAPDEPEDPLNEAVAHQNRYMAACGGAFGVKEADETFNDSNRNIIKAFIAKYGTAFLGKYNFSGDERAAVIDGSKAPLWEYAGEKLYNGCADFILPCKDENLIEMLRRWNRDGDSRVVPHITNLVEKLGGILLLWV